MDLSKLEEDAARAARDALNVDGTFDVRSPDECSLDDREQSEWDATVRATSAVLAIALAAAAEDWIAVAQSGFETWKVKPHNARWFRKIDGTPIPNDLTICIGEAFAERFRTLAAQLGGKTDA